MAKIEVATLVGLKLDHVNISDIVGIGEKNERNDVMLIQALFNLIGYEDVRANKYFGLTTKELPEPTGNFDEKTVRAIRSFQKRMASRLLNIDGKVHPASYKDRVLKKAFTGGRLMAITLLNMEAAEHAITLFLTPRSVPDAVKRIAPSIIFT